MTSLKSTNPVQMVTQDGTATTSAPSVVDLDIPEGTAVLGSGVQATLSDGGVYATCGPHPTDAAKWRFNISAIAFSTPFTCWMIVADAV